MTIRDPKAKVQAALDIIDRYCDGVSSEPLSTVISTKGSVKSAFQLIASSFSKKNRRKLEARLGLDEERIQSAIDDLKRYHPVLSREKKLMNRALSSIKKFNEAIVPKENLSWQHKLFHLLIRKSKLRHKVALPTEQVKSLPIPSSSTIFNLSKQEEDVFRMKAFTLLKKHGIVFPSIEEALKTIRETPIEAQIEKSSLSASSVLYLRQTLTPFPGETIILRGALKRDPASPIPSTPIPESFELFSESFQPGFPDPLQHNGWALAETLIPLDPLRIEEIPLLHELLKKRGKLILALQEDPEVKQKAHRILKNKMESGTKHLELQKKLFLAFFPLETQIVEEFFEELKNHSSPYIALASAIREIVQKGIITPSYALETAWANSDSRLLSLRSDNARQAAKEILESSIIEERRPFYKLMIDTIRAPAIEIALLIHSETIQYAPPLLSENARKLQSLALYQMESYLKAFDDETQNMESELNKEIAFIESEEVHPLVNQIEEYFLRRAKN